MLTIAHHTKNISYISYLHIEICNGSDIAHHEIIFWIFHMFAFWNYNLCQLPLGYPALGLPKWARGLLKETILYNLQILIIYF